MLGFNKISLNSFIKKHRGNSFEPINIAMDKNGNAIILGNIFTGTEIFLYKELLTIDPENGNLIQSITFESWYE